MARERIPAFSALVGYVSLEVRIHNMFVKQLEQARNLEL